MTLTLARTGFAGALQPGGEVHLKCGENLQKSWAWYFLPLLSSYLSEVG